MSASQDSILKKMVKRVLVPELRQGLRKQFKSHVAMEGAKNEKLTKPLITGDESTLSDAYVVYMNLFVEILEQYAPETIEGILEWGMGHSSSHFYELAQERNASLYLSIDHNEKYREYFLKHFTPAPFFESRLESLVGYSPTHVRESGENYATCALTYQRTFDLIFVDGRRRNECLLVASKVLSDNGIVILHDCDRTRYDVGSSLFDIVAEHDTTGGFRIMKKKK